MNKKLLLVPAIAFSLSFSPATFADHHEYKQGSCVERMMQMKDKLDLTEKQQEQLKQIKEKMMPEMKQNWEKMKMLHSEINELSHTDKLDEDRLNTLINQKKELVASQMKAKAMMKHEIYGVLNDEQKAKYKEMMDKWMKEHKNHHHDNE